MSSYYIKWHKAFPLVLALPKQKWYKNKPYDSIGTKVWEPLRNNSQQIKRLIKLILLCVMMIVSIRISIWEIAHVMRDYPIGFFSQDGKHFYSFFFSKKTPSISYKILQMRVLYTNPCRDTIVPSYVDAHWLKKGRGWPLLDEG